MGLGRAWRMCPGWEGHGQHLPRPPVHPVLHGVLYSVSVCGCVWASRRKCSFLWTPCTTPLCCFCNCRQYYSSWKKGNMDSAISIWFLLLWLGGDTCNLVGSFLADQLPLQVTCSDVMIASLWWQNRAATNSWFYNEAINCYFWSILWNVKSNEKCSLQVMKTINDLICLKTCSHSMKKEWVL